LSRIPEFVSARFARGISPSPFRRACGAAKNIVPSSAHEVYAEFFKKLFSEVSTYGHRFL
jgi:hypothetical protein